MEHIYMIDLIERLATENKNIYIVAYSEIYCEPKDFDDGIYFINSKEPKQIIEYIVKFVKQHSKDYEFEFDDEFYGNKAQFKIDGYKTVKIKNCNPKLKINFDEMKKILCDELIKNKLKIN